MKTIVVAGLYRSGSTWLFNAMRVILKQAGIPFNQHNIYHPELSIIVEGAEYEIYKIHQWDEQLANRADFVFTSFRNPDEVLQSYRKFNPAVNADAAWLEKALDNWRKWNEISNYRMDYIDFLQDKQKQVLMLLMSLQVSGNAISVLQQLTLLKPPTDKDYDPETCYFPNHINPKYL